jgi:hypothetical protein
MVCMGVAHASLMLMVAHVDATRNVESKSP